MEGNVSQNNKCFSKYLLSKAKITRFEKTSFERTVTEILKIKLQYLKVQTPFKTFFVGFRLSTSSA